MNVPFPVPRVAKSNWLRAQKGPLSGRWIEWNNLV